MSRKRSYTEGKAPVKGSNEKPDCGFCDQKGHNIVSCTELKSMVSVSGANRIFDALLKSCSLQTANS